MVEKKKYTAPVVEKVEFRYQEQVVASSCQDVWVNIGESSCTDDNAHWEKLN